MASSRAGWRAVTGFGGRLVRALKGAAQSWLTGRLPRRAAGLAFYTAFSLAPMLLILSILLDALFQADEAAVLGQVLHILPGSSANAVDVLVEGLRQRQDSGVAAVVGALGLAFGATGVFVALQDALDDVFTPVQPAGAGGVVPFLVRRLLSFAMLMSVGFLLLVSLVLNTLLALTLARFGTVLPGGVFLWQGINYLLALGMATGVFTLVFRFVPAAPVAWRSAVVGGVFTALLFQVGQALMAWYLGDAARLSIYGVFGSLVVLLLWVYYSAQILLFGANLARHYGTASEAPVRSRPVGAAP